ncbi:hypothetical protein Q3G72_013007 [Acer saccharum]|nr:hypothetical protein Q3G72_013007 [Acer saccharum]
MKIKVNLKSEAVLTQVIVDEILKKLDKEAIHEPKPSGPNIGESDSSHEDEEADDNKDTGEQNRGGADGGDGGGGSGGDGGDGGGGGGGDGGGGGGGEEAIHDPKRFQWITAERIFVTTNLILEVPSVVFDKLSSVHKPRYALVSMLLSFTTMLFCIIQLAYKGGEARVSWKRKGGILWLYYTTPSDKPFGTVIDFIGLLCAIFQSIFTAIDYASYLRNINDPIKISIWPLVFSFCIMCSTFSKESPKKDTSKESTDRAADIV